MNPSHYPDNLDDILAKSPKNGSETLVEHTYSVLQRLAALRTLRPTLPEMVQTPALWQLLFWACFLHDMGKAATGFQAILTGKRKESWGHRHEVLSLVAFDWIAPAFTIEGQHGIIAAILSHHRDAKDLRTLYDFREEDEVIDPLQPLVAELEESTASALWQWIHDYGSRWIADLGMGKDVAMVTMIPLQDAMATLRDQGVQRVRFWLETYQRWVRKLNNDMTLEQCIMPILLRGLTTTADHLASSHLAQNIQSIQGTGLAYIRNTIPSGKQPYSHQIDVLAHAHHSALLIAPTGSGKTETAIGWALGDGTVAVPRIFYTLPYQASMNAMYDRLMQGPSGFPAAMVGLQHGRALQALYLRFSQDAISAKDAVARAGMERNIDILHARPIKVLSPYQMLKAPFQLKGFEAMLTDYSHAACILDEIHAYEPDRLALFIETMLFLHTHFHTRFFIMSATMPSMIQEIFREALHLSDDQIIHSTPSLFEQFRRHRLQLCDGDLQMEGIDQIIQDFHQGKSVLVCSNTVKGAQHVRDSLLKKGIPPAKVVLIHSRFIMRDRIRREKEILQQCGVGITAEPVIVVTTQVIEVSLNIDLDTIYTDPAPLEALLQRFGRVNRLGKKGIVPVNVFRQPDDGQFIYGRSTKPEERGRIIRVTLNELEQHNGEDIDEAQTQQWLDTIYADPLVRQQWQESYQRACTAIQHILYSLRPFNSDPQREDEFEKLFDAVEVVPHCFEETYLTHMMNGEFLEASQYLVSIGRKKYYACRSKGLVMPDSMHRGSHARWIIRLPYSERNGLSFEDRGDEQDYD